jgi:PKD repeat protein
VTFANASALATTASFSAAGSYTLRLTANDSVLSHQDNVIITVAPISVVNVAPVANAGADQSITLPASASLVGTATDDGLPGGALTTTWSTVSGPGTVAFANASALATTASFSAAGSYTLRLTANDGALSHQNDVIITVTASGGGSTPAGGGGGGGKKCGLGGSITAALLLALFAFIKFSQRLRESD